MLAESTPTLTVFIASPGDVAEEREFVREFLESILPLDPLVRAPVAFRVVSWDHPSAGTPMLASLTPQEAVIRFKGRPADCKIVIVILAGRMGTPLGPAFNRPDGSRPCSGTEWEYEDAWQAIPRPDILVYRKEIAEISEELLDQYAAVERFFDRFKSPDGSMQGGYTSYRGAADFKTKIANDFKHLLIGHLSQQARGPAEGWQDPIVPPARCFGRDDYVALMIDGVTKEKSAALVVLGPPGIGKTTLTRQVGTNEIVAAYFRTRRWFVELNNAQSATALLNSITHAVGFSPDTNLGGLLEWLGQAPSLLILDNLETPWEREQGKVEDLLQVLATTSNVSLIASMRGSVGPSRPRWSLPPISLESLPIDEARRLFLSLSHKIPANDEHLGSFLRELGGVPLAIELVAQRAAGYTSLHELWEEWGRRGIALAEAPDLPPGSLTSVSRSLDLSWQSSRLKDDGKKLFRLLGQLPAGIAQPDRAALLSVAATEADRQVCAVGLAFRQNQRLDLLPPVRDYARQAHPPTASEEESWRRHYIYLICDVGRNIWSSNGDAALSRVAPELPNIEAALAVDPSSPLHDEALAAADGLYRIMSSTGAGSLATLQSMAGACRKSGDHSGEARWLLCLGYVAFDRADNDAAKSAYEVALPLFRKNGDCLGEALCILQLGDIEQCRFGTDAASAAQEVELPIYDSAAETGSQVEVDEALDDDDSLVRNTVASPLYHQALLLFRAAKSTLGIANCIQRLGDIALFRSNYRQARSSFTRALELYRIAGSVIGEASCIRSLGDVDLLSSNFEAARTAYRQADQFCRQIGSPIGQVNCEQRLGDLALRRGDFDLARKTYMRALRRFREIACALGEASCMLHLGEIALNGSKYDAAHASFSRALPLFRRGGSVLGEANCLRGLGDAALRQLNHDLAHAKWTEALARYESIFDDVNAAAIQRRLAENW